MRIALLNSVCTGSTGKIACGTARILQRAGHDARIFYGRGHAPSDVLSERIESAPAVYAHVALTRLTDRHGFGSALATRRLIRLLAAFDPDVIQLHNLHGYWLHLPTLANYLKTCGKPVVWTLHDCWAFTGHCAYFDMAACQGWRTGCGRCPQKGAYPQSLLLDASARNFADKRRLFTAIPNLTLVTPSEWLAALTKESFFLRTPAIVLPNGVDETVFHPVQSELRARYGLAQKRILLGVANVWEARKGLETFFALRARLDASYAIVLIGLSKKQLRALPQGILGLARTANAQELAAWYTAADVFVDPTREENFPTTHLEALSCETPVVTFCAGGSAEMLTDACGVSVPVGDTDALARGIADALRLDGADCAARAAQYRERDRFEAYLRLYERLVGDSNGAGRENAQ